MAKTLYKARIKHRKDTTANWNSKNPILLNGEFGFEVLTNGSGKFKVGDGVTAWVNLPYLPMPLDNDSHVYLDGIKASAASSASLASSQAGIAATKATEASSSASSALASKNAAASSASLASSQANIAATKAAASASSATSAAASASTATQKASEAGSYATNAANSAKQAAQSAAQSQSGVMTPADKAKLDGIETGANKYVLPPASASILGGIKVGDNLQIDGQGVVTAKDQGFSTPVVHNGYTTWKFSLNTSLCLLWHPPLFAGIFPFGVNFNFPFPFQEIPTVVVDSPMVSVSDVTKTSFKMNLMPGAEQIVSKDVAWIAIGR